jgi:hypothetical protein
MARLCRLLLPAVVALGVAATSASAASDTSLGNKLGAMWEKVLETPAPQNPFSGVPGAPAFLCVDLGGIVAPINGLDPNASITCNVKQGTKVLVAAYSAECSTLEPPPFHGDDEASLRECVRDVNSKVVISEASLDGATLPVTPVTSKLLRLKLPADNIFGVPAGHGPPKMPYLSVANGWVALTGPLAPGVHTITLHITGEAPPGNRIDFRNTTTIIVS